MTLDARSGKAIAIKLCAQKEGLVIIRGLRWCLGGVVRCVHTFSEEKKEKKHANSEGNNTKAAKSRNTSRNKAAAPVDSKFVMRTVPPMPRLHVRVLGLPPKALYGELIRCTLEITNLGSRPAASLTL